MRCRGYYGFLFLVLLIASVSLVSADFNDCWSSTGATEETCLAISGCQWDTSATDPWCDSDIGCCTDLGCWEYDGTDESTCTTNNGVMNCTWDPYMTMWYPNNTQSPPGGCMTEWTGDMVWGGMSDGAWQYNGDKAACGLNQYIWKANDINQNSWCNIKSLSDAQAENPSATLTDIGCCDQNGCWNYDGNETSCVAVLNSSCTYENSSFGSGWCMTKQCSEVTTEASCNYLAQTLFMPCSWSSPGEAGDCENSYGDGGFGAYNDTDSCFDQGGWYNSTGDCVMPTATGCGGGGGGFMFAGEAHCWFADNQPSVCNNVTGCAYCIAGAGPFGVTNATNNICYGKNIGYCEGHDTWDSGIYGNANNTENLACTDILVKPACKYGPLPNCKWTNSSANVGAYCSTGASSERVSAPPVPFCEHPDSKNNYSMCLQLIQEFMMPCTWDNASAVVKNCTFNSGAVFGSGEIDVGLVGSETACTASGGTWQTEYYLEDDILKQDSWCEQTGFLDIDNGGQEANKANCDTSCWACEFQGNGTAWTTAADGETACVASALGYCNWINDSTNSFNGFGWCDYPIEMEIAGAGDCNANCEDCDFMNSPYDACVGSVANNGTGCKWANDTAISATAGYCVDKTKKVCDSDCFSCYDVTSCQASSINCSWDMTSNLCSPDGYSGEICFDGIDNDNDQMIDCADPDCGFDNFCGGSAIGGDCFAQITEGTCNTTVAFAELNCTWLNDTWNSEGWCDMPGANCWKFDGNLTACGETAGCTNTSSGMMGASEMCDVNMTKMDNANCWQHPTEATCDGGSTDCQWKNDTWCAENNATDTWCQENQNAGWCDFKPFAACMDLNETACGGVSNCTWQTDEYSMQGGWCNVACMNWSIADSDECAATGSDGLCEWRDMSATCQPEMFMMMGTAGAGGQTGCWQYDGNETGCLSANVTCTYKSDTYSNNNLSAAESSGWCMDKGEYEHFGNMDGGDIHHLAEDAGNVMGASEPGVSGEVDIMGMGMRVTDEGLNFGAGIFNISDSIICNGRNVGAGMGMDGTISIGTLGEGSSSGEFYWYLDTDGSEAGGCNAIGDTSYPGYEFRISYVARNDSVTGITETKQLMRCNSDTGNWTATNALVTTNKQMSCGEISGVMVAVSSQDLESFSEYNKAANMRVYMSSAASADSRTSPSDYVGPGYYTPGSIDFEFVDCSNPDTKNSKCKNMKKFGFNVYEECMNAVDDDENGLVDCADPGCAFTPKCSGGTAFAFSANASDKVAPTVVYNEVDELSDGAFMKVDTNEASNMSVFFYLGDSTCSILNTTINDVGGETYQENANFKPFHALDLIDEASSLGFNLANGTSYYYKIKTCDPSGNCALSACSNFTTKTSQVDKAFIFKLDLPAGYTVDIPALNKTAYNFTETFTINGVPTTFDVGIKANVSDTKNMNMTIHSNCDDDLSIGLYGVNLYEPVKIDMTNAFICDAATNMMGMNSSLKKWNKLIDDMHLGGASDYIQMNVPIEYASGNTFNFVNDAGSGAQDVDDYVNCESGGTGVTACQVPVSLGF